MPTVVLCALPLPAPERLRLPDVDLRLTADAKALRAALPEAEVVLGGRLSPEDVRAAGRLRWLHAGGAGVDRLPLAELAAAGVRVTNARGVNADSLADHVMMLLLALSRGLDADLASQAAGVWRQDHPVLELRGLRLLVAGFGAIGRAVAARGLAFGMTITALRRHPADDPLAERVIGPEELLATLPTVDAVASCLPLTAATRGLFGADAFSALPAGALFVNVGRGGVCDEAALLAALRSGRLGGAGLDVFAAEPLPAGHPLWRAPRTIITPHLGGRQRDRGAVLQPLCEDNLARYLAGRPLRNLVDLAAGY